MQDYLITMSISIILTVIKESVKNPEKKAKWQKAMLKIRDQITLLYEEPPEGF